MEQKEKNSMTCCRFCGNLLKETFVNLGLAPLSNSYITAERLNTGEFVYPLHTYVCEQCFLVQLEEFKSPDGIFSDYAYFSSYSDSWLKHAKDYTEMIIERFALSQDSQVVEIASNDGYLLQYFKEKDIPALGIEPAKNVAMVAKEKGIDSITAFFGVELAEKLSNSGKQADLLIGNNVLAHVPDINDFVEGMHILLHSQGFITMEFPHLLNLIEKNQFDTIYHEHFSYLSFFTVKKIFEAHGLNIFDVEKLATHGGSLRIFACHVGCNKYEIANRVFALAEAEDAAGLNNMEIYRMFSQKAHHTKFDLLSLLIRLKRDGRQIVAYGAPAKGNTLLNYCGIGTEFIDYTVDKNPHKQNHYLPGSRIPIFAPEHIQETKPEYILILPWNLEEEIRAQLSYTKEWGAKFIVTVPKVEIIK